MKTLFKFFFLLGILSTACLDNQNHTLKISDQPNIVLFLVDDLGWQDTSVHFWDQKTTFNTIYETPNMERLANDGMKFTQAYATPVCSPTRVSLISGMNAAKHRVTNWTLRRNSFMVKPPEGLEMPLWNVNGAQPTDSIENSIHITPLPQILSDNGYRTIHIGKAHFGAIGTPGADPRSLGFHKNIGGHAAGAPSSYYGLKNFKRNIGTEAVWDVPGLEKYHGQDIFLTEALTQEAILEINRSTELNQPFFLYLSHYAVHTPIQGDERFENHYLNKGLDTVEAKYASLIAGIDKSLGDLMDHIDNKGLSKNTIILFMSDNGGLSAVARGGEKHVHNKPLSSGKGSMHEGGIRVPMMVKWPAVTSPNSVSDNPLIIEDFFSSILEMANISEVETIQEVDGTSFVPILKGTVNEEDEKAFFWHYPNNWGPTGPGIGAASTIRKGDWKLIYYHIDSRFELFNLKNDIGEVLNLSASNTEKLKELATDLGAYLRSVEAQMPKRTDTGSAVPWPDDTF